MYYKLYSLDDKFIGERFYIPKNFTGIAQDVSGTKRWYLSSQHHRLDGPAIEYFNGTKLWFLNGIRHRIGGPAFESSNGYKSWFINNKRVTEEQYKLYVDLLKLKGLL